MNFVRMGKVTSDCNVKGVSLEWECPVCSSLLLADLSMQIGLGEIRNPANRKERNWAPNLTIVACRR